LLLALCHFSTVYFSVVICVTYFYTLMIPVIYKNVTRTSVFCYTFKLCRFLSILNWTSPYQLRQTRYVSVNFTLAVLLKVQWNVYNSSFCSLKSSFRTSFSIPRILSLYNAKNAWIIQIMYWMYWIMFGLGSKLYKKRRT
jgi:hypothetical protein